jgi:hypothetical protein
MDGCCDRARTRFEGRPVRALGMASVLAVGVSENVSNRGGICIWGGRSINNETLLCGIIVID